MNDFMYRLMKFVYLRVGLCLCLMGVGQVLYAVPSNTFKADWQTLDSLQALQLPQSTVKKAEEVMEKARKANDTPALVKALSYRICAASELAMESDDFAALIQRFALENTSWPAPMDAFAQLMMGDLYSAYASYRQGRGGRTSLQSAEQTSPMANLTTWSLQDIENATLLAYQNALQCLIQHQNERLSLVPFREILIPGNLPDSLCPSLYDGFVYHMVEQIPTAMTFSLSVTDTAFFRVWASSPISFLNADLSASSSRAADFAIQCFQRLAQFHWNAGNRAAFAYVSLSRYSYLRDHFPSQFSVAQYRLRMAELASFSKGTTAYPQVLYTWIQSCQNGTPTEWVRAVQLCDALMAVDSRDTLSLLAENIKQKIQHNASGLRLALPSSTVIPQEAIKANLYFRNTDTVFLKIYRLTSTRFFDHQTFTPAQVEWWIRTQTPVSSDFYVMPHTEDYATHSTEVKIKGLAAGLYMMVYSNALLDRTDYPYREVKAQALYVSQLYLMAKRNSQEVTWVIADRKSGKPLPKAVVDVNSALNQRAFTPQRLETDEKGMVSFQSEIYAQADVSYRGDTLFRQPIRSYGSVFYTDEERLSTLRTYLYTDRSIYRPGQQIQFSGLVTREMPSGDRLQVAEVQPVTLTWLDANGTVIDSLQCITNRFGSFSGVFQIPEQGPTGYYSLFSSSNGETSVRVEAYKRPTFEIRFDTLTTLFAYGDTIRLQGVAQTFSGYAVNEASVAYTVTREDHRFYRLFREASEVVVHDTCLTDTEGYFTLVFPATPPLVRGNHVLSVYRITASVTDLSGETQEQTTLLRMGEDKLYLYADLPEMVTPTTSAVWEVRTENAQGQSVAAQLKVNIRSLKAPKKLTFDNGNLEFADFPMSFDDHERDFPFLTCGNQAHPDSFALGEEVFSQRYPSDATHPLSKDIFNPLPAGWYEISLQASTPDGALAETRMRFRVIKEKPEKMVTMQDWCTPIKTSGMDGEYYEFRVAGGLKQGYLLYEHHFGEDSHMEWIKIGQEPKVIRIPVTPESDGGVVQFFMVQQNTWFHESYTLTREVPDRNLEITFSSFRPILLPGATEQWTLHVTDRLGKPVYAELLATMYDASLDKLYPHAWPTSLRPARRITSASSWYTPYSDTYAVTVAQTLWKNTYYAFRVPALDLLSCLPRYVLYRHMPLMMSSSQVLMEDGLAMENASTEQMTGQLKKGGKADGEAESASEGSLSEDSSLSVRENFNETAFFAPHLLTDSLGNVQFSFTLPESLTRWKMMGRAHTREMQTGTVMREVIAQKPLAIVAHIPRVLRQGDTLQFVARLYNLVDSSCVATSQLTLYDERNGNELKCIGTGSPWRSTETQTQTVSSHQTSTVKWVLVVPQDISAIRYRISCHSGLYSDGEENVIPVLDNRTLVTETLPMVVPGGTQKSFTLQKAIPSVEQRKTSSSQPYLLSLEMASQPIWYAIQSLPYIMDFDTECVEQMYSRFFANSMASYIARRTPRVAQVFAAWKQKANTSAWLSTLAMNPEFKQVLLEETPWVMAAHSEAEQRSRMGVLFDVERMAEEQDVTLTRLRSVQFSDGSFGWFKGASGVDRAITLHVATGLMQLRRAGAIQPAQEAMADLILGEASTYLQSDLNQNYQRFKSNQLLSGNHLQFLDIQYLYLRSLISLDKDFLSLHPNFASLTEAESYYLDQTVQYWPKRSSYEQGLMALALYRMGRTREAQQIVQSLSERVMHRSTEQGAYWSDVTYGYQWQQAPIEAHALMTEVYAEVAQDSEMVEAIQIWLLRQKQSNHWGTTKATVAACYALMCQGTFMEDVEAQETPMPQVALGGVDWNALSSQSEESDVETGYRKTSWTASQILPSMRKVTVQNSSRSLIWGALYYQYFEDLDKITASTSGLQVDRQYYKVVKTDSGEQLAKMTDEKLHVGDLIRVRMVIRASQDMEYVHLKDMRAGGLEPLSTVSEYKYQDGLGYFESPRDAGTHFFIQKMLKGTYVFEYDVRATHQGVFSTGMATLQCYYAPSLNAHSAGETLSIE